MSDEFYTCCVECLGTGERYPHEERDDNYDCPVCEGLGMVETNAPEDEGEDAE
jgi:hypothetical protein